MWPDFFELDLLMGLEKKKKPRALKTQYVHLQKQYDSSLNNLI